MIFSLTLASSFGQSNLPKCGDRNKSNFHNCFGSWTLENGDKYVGEWKNNLPNGHGTFYYLADNESKGSIYTGEFKDDNFHGLGTFNFVNGDKYIGEYKDNKRNGQGIFFRSNGRVGLGEWVDGKPNGLFIEYASDKSIERSGLFKNGKLTNSQVIDPSFFSRISSFSNFNSSVIAVPQIPQEGASQNLDSAKTKCAELGFKPSTEGFGKCVLQLTK